MIPYQDANLPKYNSVISIHTPIKDMYDYSTSYITNTLIDEHNYTLTSISDGTFGESVVVMFMYVCMYGMYVCMYCNWDVLDLPPKNRVKVMLDTHKSVFIGG